MTIPTITLAEIGTFFDGTNSYLAIADVTPTSTSGWRKTAHGTL